MTTITERVEQGADLLDEKRPGWWRVIDLDRLDISQPCNCVAGQLGALHEGLTVSAYGDGLAMLDISQKTAVACGLDFACDAEQGTASSAQRAVDEEYRQLTEAWRALILKRREVSP